MNKTANHSAMNLLWALPLDLHICSLHLLPASHPSQPTLNEGVGIQRQPRKRILPHPRLRMIIHSGNPSGQNTLSIRFLQLPFQHPEAAIRLLRISIQRILVLHRMVVP